MPCCPAAGCCFRSRRKGCSAACCWSAVPRRAPSGRRNSPCRAQFVGCVGLQDEEAGRRLKDAFGKGWENVRSLHLDSAPDETCWFAGEGWWLSTAEAEVMSEATQISRTTPGWPGAHSSASRSHFAASAAAS